MRELDTTLHLRIDAQVARQTIEHADREAPHECCGLLAGRHGVIDEHYALPNAAPEPERRYFAEPRALVDAMRAIRERQQDLVGIYHSHPQSAPEPTSTDIEQAYYPECAYIIIGPAWVEPRLRAFRIAHGRAEPLSITWVEP